MNPKRSVYGPDQFTEEDVLAVAQELEKEDPAKPGKEEEAITGDDDDRSKSDSCQKKRCSQCQVRVRSYIIIHNPPVITSTYAGFYPPRRGLPGLLACTLSKVLAPTTGKHCEHLWTLSHPYISLTGHKEGMQWVRSACQASGPEKSFSVMETRSRVARHVSSLATFWVYPLSTLLLPTPGN